MRLSRPTAPAGGWPRDAAPGCRFGQGLAGAIRVGNLQRSARVCQIWHPNAWAASQAPRVGMASESCCQKCSRCWSWGSCHCPGSWMGAQAVVPQATIRQRWARSRQEENELMCRSEAGAAGALLGIPPARDCSRACTFPCVTCLRPWERLQLPGQWRTCDSENFFLRTSFSG